MQHAMRVFVSCALAACIGSPVAALKQQQRDQSVVNPIRKVVTMLQKMQKKVEQEGVEETNLYDKFMCYCNSGGKDLEASISAASGKVSDLPSQIDAAEARLVQLKDDIKQHQTDRYAAKEAMAKATAIREKEAAAYAGSKTETDATNQAIAKAVAALEKGMAGGFLQTASAHFLKDVVMKKEDIREEDRQVLLSFLASGTGSSYAPQSGDVVGILKQMGDDLASNLADATTAEEEAIKTYEELMRAKTQEVEALTASIEKKLMEVGELGVSIVAMKDDLTDTEAALMADKEFLVNLDKSCKTKTAEWEVRLKTRADELTALGETIKLLNDDDALDLFKKTLPSASASFAQVQVNVMSVRARALEMIRKISRGSRTRNRPGLDFMILALSGRKTMSRGGFEKVVKMCDDMVAELKKEQLDDENKKEYCSVQFDQMDDKKKSLERTIDTAAREISKAKDAIETLTEEIAALEAGIVELDKSVIAATEQRRAENQEFKDELAANGAAKELLVKAKKRLNQFYNPTVALLAAAGDHLKHASSSALIEIAEHTRHSREAPAPPPTTWDAYAKKSGESGGVVAMLDLLIKDLEKDITESKVDEENNQSDYETMMKESAAKRAEDSKSLAAKLEDKADAEKALSDFSEVKKDTASELMATLKYIQSLHLECDWLLQYFDIRKKARSDEIDSLLKAKAVLSGADMSFLQTKD